MDSEEETLYDDVDSGNESSGDDVDFVMDVDSNNTRERQTDVDEYPFEVLSTEEIVQHMVDSIREVNTVVEVSSSIYNELSKLTSLKEVRFCETAKHVWTESLCCHFTTFVMMHLKIVIVNEEVLSNLLLIYKPIVYVYEDI